MAIKNVVILSLIVDGKVLAKKTGKKIPTEWQRLVKLRGIEIKTEYNANM